MKVKNEPVSAFAVYAEKLKQKKKKKTKLHSSNGINKLKTQVSNTLNKPTNNSGDKQSWKMKEIGYILQKLTEGSADTSSHRTTALLKSISEANEKLEHSDNTPPKNVLDNVTLVKYRKKKTKAANDLNGKKATKPLYSDISTSNLEIVGTSNIKNGTVEAKASDIPGKSMTSPSLSPVDKSKTTSRPTVSILKKTKTSIRKNKNFHRNLQNNLGDQPLYVSRKKLNTILSERKQKKKNLKSELTSKTAWKQKCQKKRPENSNEFAMQLFGWLIAPVLEVDFMRDFWERQPLLIQRESNRNYFSELLNTETIDGMLRENNVCFTKHLDVTSYSEGVRETHNLTGRAQANVVWDFYSNGCSVRLLNPQIFLPKIHVLNTTLQEYFGCFVGANVYLTPPNAQGFAPHYDDIEAFVLQIEGKKHWKVYTPRNDKEVLPRFSSPNFSQDEIGEPFLDVTLEPGDLLYFPRGFIHQASTVDGEHSLHITLSAYQKTSWVDLLEKALPIALKRAAENDVDFRRGLPREYLGLEYRGSAEEKLSFVDTADSLMRKLGHYLQISLGAGVDQMGAQFMHDALPPVITPNEKQNSSLGGGLKLKNGKLEGRIEFEMDTCVKLIRFNVCRLVEEEGEVRLYHCLDNPLEYHAEEPQFLVLPPEGIPVLNQLLTSYPAFVAIKDLPHEDQEALLTLISDLWDAGLLFTKELPVVEER